MRMWTDLNPIMQCRDCPQEVLPSLVSLQEAPQGLSLGWAWICRTTVAAVMCSTCLGFKSCPHAEGKKNMSGLGFQIHADPNENPEEPDSKERGREDSRKSTQKLRDLVFED